MDSETVGGRSEGVGGVLQCGGTGGVAVRDGDVAPRPKDGAGPGKFQTQGREYDHWESDVATSGWELVIPASGGGIGGSGF